MMVTFADGLELLQFKAGWKAKILKVHTSALTLELTSRVEGLDIGKSTQVQVNSGLLIALYIN